MFISKRAIYFAAGGILFVLLFSFLLTAQGAFFVYNFLFFIAAVVDFIFTPSKKQIRITRGLENKLSLGAKNDVTFEVSNTSGINAFIQLKDEIPDVMEPDRKLLEIKVAGHSGESVKYSVYPTRRGKYKFGSIHVRVHGLLGIVGRKFKVPADSEIKVYPNIKEISRYRLLARKNRLLEVGLKPSKIFGFGTDFEYLRDYQPDDAYRNINWKATARRSKLVTAQYQTERSQNIMIVIEAGRMMTSRIDKITKLDYALNAALLLGYVSMDKGDNVGLMVFSDDIKTFIPPKRGKNQLGTIVESLYNLEPEIVEPDYGKAFRYLSLKNRKRSLVVFFTDLIDTEVSKAIVVYTRALYPAHLPLCCAISDTALYEEADQPAIDKTALYRKATAEDLLRQREQVKTVLHRGGVMTLDVPPKMLTPELITRYLSIKARNRL